MTTKLWGKSHVRKQLRMQRQAKRSWELTPDFITKHPDAARMYVQFGGTIEECLAEVAKRHAGDRPRELRAERRRVKLIEKAKKFMENRAAEARRRAMIKEESAKLKQQRADQRGVARQMTRKGIT